MQLLLYPETALPLTTLAGSENCTGCYLETSGVLLFVWNMLPQGQVITNLPSQLRKDCDVCVSRQACIVTSVI